MEKKQTMKKKPTMKYEKPVLVDLTPEQASGAPVCYPLGSQDYNYDNDIDI